MKLKVAVAICLVFALAVFASWALAQSGNTDLYTACVNNSSGTIHVLSEGETCANNEMLIQWNQAGTIGASEVHIGGEHFAWEHGVRAFIPTESSDTACLVTLAESNFLPPQAVYCGARVVDGVKGVLVTILYPTDQPGPNPNGFYLAFTVYQEHAKMYGPPVLYTGS